LKPTILRQPTDIKGDAISISVSIWRWIFRHYFSPTAFKLFDSDHQIDEILEAKFRENPSVIALLEEKWHQLQAKITKRNSDAILLWEPRVDLEGFISEELWWSESDAYKVFQVFFDRMQWFEKEEKERIFQSIEREDKLSEDDYLFILELFAFERCNFQEFRKLLKFIRSTQYAWHLIIASLKSMRNQGFKESLIELVEEKWTDAHRADLSWFM